MGCMGKGDVDFGVWCIVQQCVAIDIGSKADVAGFLGSEYFLTAACMNTINSAARNASPTDMIVTSANTK